MSRITLRPYQRKLLYDARTALYLGKHPLLTAPTGAGKMVILSALAKELKSQTLIIEHRRELIQQAKDTLDLLGVPYGVIASGKKNPNPDALVQVGMVQTIARRGDEGRNIRNIVMDECHLAMASGYQKVAKLWPNARRVGLTATPERLDGLGFEPFFDVLIHGPSVPELIDSGDLVPMYVKHGIIPDMSGIGMDPMTNDLDQGEVSARLNTTKLIGDIVGKWHEFSFGRTTVVFATSIQHSINIRNMFLAAGVKAAHIDGTTPPAEREDVLAKLRSGEITVCCNANLLIEGVDVKRISCVILAYRTYSIAKYLQSIGRGSRPDLPSGKTDLMVHDHGDNFNIHGSPDVARVWSLDGKPPRVTAVRAEDLPEDALVWQDAEPQYEDDSPNLGFGGGRRAPLEVAGDLVDAPSGWLPERRRVLRGDGSGYTDVTVKRVSNPQPAVSAPQPAAVEIRPARAGLPPPRPCPRWALPVQAVWDQTEIERYTKGLSLTYTEVLCKMRLMGVK